MLCFSYSLHFICTYLSFSFMFHVCINLRSGYRKTMRARRRCAHCMKQWSMRARRRYNHCMKQWSMRARRRCDILYPKVSSLYETVTIHEGPEALWRPFRGHRDPNGIYVIDPNGASILELVCCRLIFPLIGMPIYPSTRF